MYRNKLKKYKVIVKDTVNQDGTYYTKAYSKKEAVDNVQKENNIANTSSHSGSSYCPIKIN